MMPLAVKPVQAAITYALLGQLAGTLVLAVPQQLDNTALIGGKAKVKRIIQRQ